MAGILGCWRSVLIGAVSCLVAHGQSSEQAPTMSSMAEHVKILAAAEDGDPVAAYLAGDAYLKGKLVSRNTAEALRWLTVASKAGVSEASNRIAWIYIQGSGVKADPAAGASWFRIAAEQGDREANYQLGWMYQYGRGVQQDNRAAVEWYRRGVEHGDEDAMASLAWMLENGLGIEKDESAAAHLYQRAAAEGSAMAMTNLAWQLIEGRGVQRSVSRAVELIQEAARRGHPRGEGSLGYLYQHGLGIEKDLGNSLHWFKVSAEHEDLKSIRHLASALFIGRPWPRDEQTAMKFARLGLRLHDDPACLLVLSRCLIGRPLSQGSDMADLLAEVESAYHKGVLEAVPLLVWFGLQDPRLAVRIDLEQLFHSAARHEPCRSPLFMLSRGLEFGIFGSPDRSRSKAWDTILMAAGFTPARLAVARHQLSGAPEDRLRGLESLQALSDEGDAGATFELAKAHEQGLASDRSPATTMKWFRLAAKRGHPGAMMEMAFILHSGRLGETNLAEASDLYRRLQSQGLPLPPTLYNADGTLREWSRTGIRSPGITKPGETKGVVRTEVFHTIQEVAKPATPVPPKHPE